jgi:hypothetical protein
MIEGYIKEKRGSRNIERDRRGRYNKGQDHRGEISDITV